MSGNPVDGRDRGFSRAVILTVRAAQVAASDRVVVLLGAVHTGSKQKPAASTLTQTFRPSACAVIPRSRWLDCLLGSPLNRDVERSATTENTIDLGCQVRFARDRVTYIDSVP